MTPQSVKELNRRIREVAATDEAERRLSVTIALVVVSQMVPGVVA